MSRLRLLLAAALAAVALPASAGARAIHVEVPLTCGDGSSYKYWLTLDATIPDSTAPGEVIQLKDISGTFRFRNDVVLMPTIGGPGYPTVGWIDIDAIELSARGTTSPNLTVGGLPAQLPSQSVPTTGYQDFTARIAGPLQTTTTTAGTAPVLLEIAAVKIRLALGYSEDSRPTATTGQQTCTPREEAPVLAVIKSTADLPPAPVVTSVSPTSGPLLGGNVVTLKGDHFTYATDIVGDRPRAARPPFVIKDDETIEYTIPTTYDDGGDSYNLLVKSPFGTAPPTPTTLYSRGGLPSPPPTITAVTPNSLPTTGRTVRFTILGTGLDRIGTNVTLRESDSADSQLAYAETESVNDDGTEAVIIAALYSNADWPVGVLNVSVQASGPCGTADCISADTPADDLTFYDPAAAKPLPTITSVSPNRFPYNQSKITFTIKGTGLNDIEELVKIGAFQGFVESTSPDGTEVVVAAAIYDRDWSIGPANVSVRGTGPCVVSDCRSIDTPADDLTFYVPAPPEHPSAFAAQGAVTLKTLIKGSAPLTGALTGVAPAADTGAISADLSLNPTTAKLTALGLLPVTARLAFVPTETVTGTLTGTSLALVAKLRIKIPRVTLFGLEIAGGAGCQARQISSVRLVSTGAFALTTGGPLAGTFTISDLAGCGALTGLISPLTAGKGNAIALNLTPTN